MNSDCVADSSVRLCRGASQAAQTERWHGIKGGSDAALENWILSLPLLQHSGFLKQSFCVPFPHFPLFRPVHIYQMGKT